MDIAYATLQGQLEMCMTGHEFMSHMDRGMCELEMCMTGHEFMSHMDRGMCELEMCMS